MVESKLAPSACVPDVSLDIAKEQPSMGMERSRAGACTTAEVMRRAVGQSLNGKVVGDILFPGDPTHILYDPMGSRKPQSGIPANWGLKVDKDTPFNKSVSDLEKDEQEIEKLKKFLAENSTLLPKENLKDERERLEALQKGIDKKRWDVIEGALKEKSERGETLDEDLKKRIQSLREQRESLDKLEEAAKKDPALSGALELARKEYAESMKQVTDQLIERQNVSTPELKWFRMEDFFSYPHVKPLENGRPPANETERKLLDKYYSLLRKVNAEWTIPETDWTFREMSELEKDLQARGLLGSKRKGEVEKPRFP